MSRIGKKLIDVPKNVHVKLCSNVLSIIGPEGKGEIPIPQQITVQIDGQQVSVKSDSSKKHVKSLWGLTRSLIYNMVSGVHKPFEKKLLLVGPGYKCKISKNYLILSLGYSHDIIYEMHSKAQMRCEKENILYISSYDKSIVGQIAAEIRSLRKVEPYKGKGIRYDDETIILKKGKDNKK